MNRSWFDDINDSKSTSSCLREESGSRKRNVRYTPSAKSQRLSTHLCKRKRSPKLVEQIRPAPVTAITRCAERNVCIVNQEEVDHFLNLICKLF